MRNYIILLLLLAAPSAFADDHGHFFFYVAPGLASSNRSFVLPAQLEANTMLVHMGGGGEGALTDTFGVGTDIGGVFPTNRSSKVGIICANAFYHPAAQHHVPLDPFVTAGYAWLLGSDAHLSTPNVGGGLNYWFKERHDYNFGLKVDVRFYVRSGGQSVKYSELRLGVALWQ